MAAPHLTRRMAGLLENIRRANRAPFHAMTPPEARRSYAAAAEILEFPRAPLARVEALRIPSFDGTALPARLYANSHPNTHEPLPARLCLHGGGFTIGGLETRDNLAAIGAPLKAAFDNANRSIP